MNVEIIAVDKLREAYIREGCAMYVKRLRPLMPVLTHEIRASAAENGIEIEGAAILGRMRNVDVLWALDVHGKSISSIDLARLLAQAERSGRTRLVLAIGGPSGLSQSVIKRATFVWSLSKLTFLHEMARLIVLEQLYRAAKIKRGEPYHK